MSVPRRSCPRSALGVGVLAAVPRRGAADNPIRETTASIARAASDPVLEFRDLAAPAVIASIELLRR